jgi:hypothetical protein
MVPAPVTQISSGARAAEPLSVLNVPLGLGIVELIQVLPSQCIASVFMTTAEGL